VEFSKTIKELSASNRHLAYTLKKQIKKNDEMQEELQKAIKTADHFSNEALEKWQTESSIESKYIKRIETLEFTVRALHAEKNVLLRKLGLQPEEKDYGTRNKQD
jgi:DNA-directed RNA polymerase alpha subunit